MWTFRLEGIYELLMFEYCVYLWLCCLTVVGSISEITVLCFSLNILIIVHFPLLIYPCRPSLGYSWLADSCVDERSLKFILLLKSLPFFFFLKSSERTAVNQLGDLSGNLFPKLRLSVFICLRPLCKWRVGTWNCGLLRKIFCLCWTSVPGQEGIYAIKQLAAPQTITVSAHFYSWENNQPEWSCRCLLTAFDQASNRRV